MDKNELRRLEKAARDKNKRHLMDWAMQFENQIRYEYEKAYEKEIESSVNNFLVAIAYTLVFTEEIKLEPGALAGVIEDLIVTVDLFRTGEQKPEDYMQALKENGAIFDEYDYSKVFREKEGKYEKIVNDSINIVNDLKQLIDKSNKDINDKLSKLSDLLGGKNGNNVYNIDGTTNNASDIISGK